MTIETPGTRPKLAAIQYLRAAAALGVVLYHATLAAGAPVRAGAYGVTLFFVISGFIMVSITDAETRPGPFLADRVRRIVPIYWLATLAAVVSLMTLGPGYGEGWEGLAASLFFLPYGNPDFGRHYFPVLDVGWTLNYEMMFYVLFAAALLLPRRFQLIALSMVFLSLTAVGHAAKPQTAPLEFWCDPIILQFLVGAWIAAAAKPKVAGVPGWLAGAALAALLLLAPITLPAAFLLAGAVAMERHRRVRSFRLPLLLGDASYSIYLWHVSAVVAATLFVRHLDLPPLLIVPLGIAGGVIAGLVAYRLVEKPLLRLLGRKAAAAP